MSCFSTELVGINLAPGSRLPVRTVQTVEILTSGGLVGDRYEHSRRPVTIQSAEQLAQAADELGYPFEPGATRRNLTVREGEIPLKYGARITIGEVELEVIRYAAPCRLLDRWIGPGALGALRRRSGAICRTITGGTLTLGDPATWSGDAG